MLVLARGLGDDRNEGMMSKLITYMYTEFTLHHSRWRRAEVTATTGWALGPGPVVEKQEPQGKSAKAWSWMLCAQLVVVIV